MKKINKKLFITILLVISIISYLSYNIFFREDASSTYALSKYGSVNDEVKQIQTKLKRWGYYNGTIDGIYGSQTLSAVKWFQSKNGLTVDRNSRTKNFSCNGNFLIKYNVKNK